MKKSDIQFHSHNGWNQRTAINIKIYDWIGKEKIPYPDMHWMFNHDWIEENIREELFDIYWALTCEWSIECIKERAYTLFPNVDTWTEGRSGGWFVVDFNKDDVFDWDAIMLSKWRSLCKYVSLCKKSFNEDLLRTIYVNEFEYWLEEHNKIGDNIVAAQG